MPPKKKGGKGKSGLGAIVDGVDTSSMSREQLEVFALRLREEMEREREERNFFQLERDKIRTFWEITRNELNETRAKLRNKERDMDEANEKNAEDIKHSKQKVKHLQYEHMNLISEYKAETMVAMKEQQEDHVEQENELLRDKRELKRQLREAELNFIKELKALKLQESKEVSRFREHYENLTRETEQKYEKKFGQYKDEMQTKHRIENVEMEERKNTQIQSLMKNHDQALNDMKNYYNDITLNNLALISTLKDQMEAVSLQNERMQKQVADVMAENKRLSEPLRKAQQENEDLRKRLINYDKDKLSLATMQSKLAATGKTLEELKWANDVLELRFEKIRAERDELSKRFMDAILEIQRKTASKGVMLRHRMQKLAQVIEFHGLYDNMKKTKYSSKNTYIENLKYEIARLCKAHDDLIATYEEKLQQYSIPKEELGYNPLRVVPNTGERVCKMPAGLVTKNK